MIRILYILLIASLFITLLTMVSAVVDCGVVPTSNCSVNTSRSFNLGTYNLNGSANGAIQAAANNIIIDCNGSTFIGNSTTDSNVRFTKLSGFNNVTWKNCIIKNYYTGIAWISSETSGFADNITINGVLQGFDITSADNINISNSNVDNSTTYGVYLEPNSNKWDNISILNSTFGAAIPRPIRAEGHPINHTSGLLIYGNTIYNNTLYIANSDLPRIRANVITSNQTNGGATLGEFGIEARNLTNGAIFAYNNISLYDSGISFATDIRMFNYTGGSHWDCGTLSNNINLTYNNLTMNDRGMKLRGISGLSVNHNLFLNNTDGVDDYDDAIYLEECSNNITIDSNNFSQTGSTGIYAQDQDGLIISNNNFDMLSQSEKQALLVNDIFEYPAAIQISQMYKMFLQANRTGLPFNGENLTFTSSMLNNNVTLINNTFDSDTQVYLMAGGVSNLTTDLSGYWYRKFSPYSYLIQPLEYYIPNAQSRLYWTNSLGALKQATNYSYGNTTSVYPRMQVNFTSSSFNYLNTNLTGQIVVDLYNVSSFYNSTIKSGSYLTDANSNITLNVGEGFNGN